MPSDDYYTLLGIDESADDETVRRAWRKLALEWHPDRAGSEATQMFQRISVAYAVLSDPDARAAYDRWRETLKPRTPPDRQDPIGPRAPGVMIRRLSGSLNALLARGVATWASEDVIDLFLEPQEAAEGGMVTISMRVATKGGGEDLFAAWLAVRPGVVDGTILTPSAWLPDMERPVYFRVRL